jgi:hypothetical protein
MNFENLIATLPLLFLVLLGVLYVRWLKRAASNRAVGQAGNGLAPRTLGGLLERAAWLLACLGCLLGGARLLDMALGPDLTAPQYAAMAAGACAWVVVPYVLARAVQALRNCKR